MNGLNGVRFPCGMAIVYCVQRPIQFFEIINVGAVDIVCARSQDCAISLGFVLNCSSIHVPKLGRPQNKEKN